MPSTDLTVHLSPSLKPLLKIRATAAKRKIIARQSVFVCLPNDCCGTPGRNRSEAPRDTTPAQVPNVTKVFSLHRSSGQGIGIGIGIFNDNVDANQPISGRVMSELAARVE